MSAYSCHISTHTSVHQSHGCVSTASRFDMCVRVCVHAYVCGHACVCAYLSMV